MDYLKAYVQALAQEKQREDHRIEDQVQARLGEVLEQLAEPHRKALQLRAHSELTRGQIHQMLARGDPDRDILTVALSLIGELIGDEDFARHNLKYLDPNRPNPQNIDPRGMMALEYKGLIKRIDQMVAYLGDESVPLHLRESAMPQFDQMDQRARALLHALGGDPDAVETGIAARNAEKSKEENT